MARNAKNTRMCAGCMKRASKEELLCVKRQNDNAFVIDTDSALDGRGAYLCYNAICLERAIKRKAFQRSFKCSLPEEVTENIRQIINSEARE